MRVMVLGLRGFPGIQGGIETHAEHLYPRLRDLGCAIEVVVRAPHWTSVGAPKIPGIRFHPLWCPSSTGAEALVHSFLGVLYAARRRPDVLHIHAIGPALFAPLAKLLGLKVVVTHHGPDYDREKWSRIAKLILRTGEALGVRFADARIVISGVIEDLVRRKYHRRSDHIPNGVDIPGRVPREGAPASFGLNRGRYVLTVSRMVPEKRHLDLIRAFGEARPAGWKLALVGGLDGGDAYTRKVVEAAACTPGVVLTGFLTGQTLGELYADAGLFVLPSTHEGLPIALLEALSFGLPVLASDIPANLEVGLPAEQYFRAGDVDDLARRLMEAILWVRPADYRRRVQEWVRGRYDWRPIAQATLGVYKRVCQRDWRERVRLSWLPE